MRLLQELTYQTTMRPRIYFLKKLLPTAKIYPTGSRYICNPPVFYTDIDFLVWAEDTTSTYGALSVAGYGYSYLTEYNCADAQNSVFFSYRKGPVNLIVTQDREFTDQYRVATHICRHFNTREKHDRIAVHETLRGNDWTKTAYTCSDTLRPLLDRLSARFVTPYRKTMIRAYMAQHDMEPT